MFKTTTQLVVHKPIMPCGDERPQSIFVWPRSARQELSPNAPPANQELSSSAFSIRDSDPCDVAEKSNPLLIGLMDPGTDAIENDACPVNCDGQGHENDLPTSTMEEPPSARPQHQQRPAAHL